MDGTAMSLQDIINLAIVGSGEKLASHGEDAARPPKVASASAPALATAEAVQQTVNTIADLLIKEAEGANAGPAGALPTFPEVSLAGKPNSAIDPGKAHAAAKMRAIGDVGSKQTPTDAPTMMQNRPDTKLANASQSAENLFEQLPEAMKKTLINGAAAKGRGSAALVGATIGALSAAPAAYLGARMSPKTASSKSDSKYTAAIRTFLKEGSINGDVVNISAAHHAPPLDAVSHVGSGSSGPAGEGSNLIMSNESAMHFTKQEAKAKPKRDMEHLLGEPVQRPSTDKVLSQALSHSSGPNTSNKIASVVQMDPALVNARLLINRLAGSV